MLRGGENIHAIPATAHRFFMTSTCCSTTPMMVSCAIQRSAAMASEAPTRRCSSCETAEMNAMKATPMPTCDQSRWETDVGADGCMEILGVFYNRKKEEGISKICHTRVFKWKSTSGLLVRKGAPPTRCDVNQSLIGNNWQ